MPYTIEITAKAGCGCEAEIEFLLDDEPKVGDVGAVLYTALDPDETNLLDFLVAEHHNGGHEKITVTAQVKVR